jgi:capsid assembly protease
LENNISRVWSLLKSQTWAIKPEKLEEIIAVLQMKIAGVDVTFEPQAKKAQTKNGKIAVLPLFGIIGQRMNMLIRFSGGTSTELFTRDLRGLLADPEVGGVIVDIDSPGGGVFGVAELAEEIFKSRGRKPIWGVANSEAASAGYWIGSAVEDLAVTPGGEVGSIGVYALHSDFSEAQAKEGIKNTLIKAGRLKTAGNPYEPLEKEARDYLQSGVNRYYRMFVEGVAKYRGKNVEDVKNGFGEGGMTGSRDAVKMGMADRVATLDETIWRMQREIRSGVSKSTRRPRPLTDDDSVFSLEDRIARRRWQLS